MCVGFERASKLRPAEVCRSSISLILFSFKIPLLLLLYIKIVVFVFFVCVFLFFGVKALSVVQEGH